MDDAHRTAGPVVLVVNSGSSSLKYDVVDPGDAQHPGSGRLASGVVERIGGAGSRVVHTLPGREPVVVDREVADHPAALALMREVLSQHGPSLDRLGAVGHRVVHGADRYRDPVLVDDEVEAEIDRLAVLAPLHNPANLAGLQAMRAAYPDVPHVAVFDTAFHSTLPAVARSYAVPTDLAERHSLRKWGFQGTSVAYVTRLAAGELGVSPDSVRLIVCHVGNGVSVTAVLDGRSVDTSMGLTPLSGAVMGSRSGDIDAAAVAYLVRAGVGDVDEVDAMLWHRSGLRGMCGDNDLRTVRQRAREGDPAARLALDVYAYRLRTLIGSYLAVVPGLHAVVFTAGVGENDADLRREVIEPMGHLGLTVDPEANAAAVGPDRPCRIEADGPVAVLVVPTDEAAEIARHVRELLAQPSRPV